MLLACVRLRMYNWRKMAAEVKIPLDLEDEDITSDLSFQNLGTSREDEISGDMKLDEDGMEYEKGDFHSERTAFLKSEELSEENSSHKQRKYLAFLTAQPYQKFFDVSTRDVLQRIIWGTVPRVTPFGDVIRNKGDLYGPFWVCMTLVYVLAISCHFGTYLSKGRWQLVFNNAVIVFCIVYAYAWLFSVLVWGFFWWRAGTSSFTLLETICIYGYSMSGYNLFLVLTLIPLEWLRWTIVALLACTTGLVLIYPFWKLLKDQKDKKMAFILVVQFLVHAGIGVGLKFYCLLPHQAIVPEFTGTDVNANVTKL